MKLIESLSMRTPTIVTPRVAAGAGIEPGVHSLVADHSDEWVDATLLLLSDESLRISLASAGYHWAKKYHSMDSVRAQFREAGVVS